MTAREKILKRWLPLAVVVVVATAIALPPILASATTTQHAIESWLEVYTKNIFGWTLTYVKTTAYAVFANPGTFDTFSSYTNHVVWAAWWCISCYANAQKIVSEVTPTIIGEEDAWTMGSWNVRYTGTIDVWLKAKGSDYKVYDKMYYNTNGVQNLVLDKIIQVVKFVIEHYKEIAGILKSGEEEGHALIPAAPIS